MATLSRRDLIVSSGSLWGPFFAKGLAGEPIGSRSLRLALIQEFANATAHAVSPDGRTVCLEDWKVSGYPLRIVEVDTGRMIYSGRFQSRVLTADFFADGRALFLQFPGVKGQLFHRQALVDIKSGERTERMRSFDPFQYSEQMLPVDDRTLLVAHRRLYPHQPPRIEWFSRLEFPSYREQARIEPPAEQDGSRPSGGGLFLSADRSIAVYSSNNALVCRRTPDLNVLWTRPFEGGLRPAQMAVSAQGEYVAAVVTRVFPAGEFERYEPLYVSVYRIKDGVEIGRLPLKGEEGLTQGGIALSPDGELIALVARENGKGGEILPTVYLQEVASGRKLASVVHDHIMSGRRQFLDAGCTVSFTSDGRYIVSSGVLTKVWRLSE